MSARSSITGRAVAKGRAGRDGPRALGLLGALCAAAAFGPGALAGPSPGVAADSGRPPISWTWTTIERKPGEPRGYVEFQRACSVCHGSGPAPGTRALRAKYRGRLPALLEQRTDLAADYVRSVVRHGVSVMPPFRKVELSDADLDAIVAYLTHERAPGRSERGAR